MIDRSLEDGDTSKIQNAAREITFPDGSLCVIGIIDILQAWDFSKKLERFFKVYIRRKDREGISCVEPFKYASRFSDQMEEILEVS